jgi:hypothetical protein
MSTYNHNRYTPGNKSNLRLFLNKALIRQFNHLDDTSTDTLCGCIQQKANLTKQGWNDPSQTKNQRITQILTGTLGGKTTFGNLNKPVNVNYLGGWEGQPGGSFKPLRNKF